jgi:hypothetical protein
VPWFGRGKRNELESLNAFVGDNYFYINDFQGDQTTVHLNTDHSASQTKCWLGNMNFFGQPDDDTPFLNID